jgi:hypothetical protein
MPPSPRLLCAVLALAACSAGASVQAPPSAAVSPPAPAAAAAPRYVVFDAAWIERAGDVDRVVVNGRRLELRGMEIARLGPAEPEIEGGARVPPWSPAGSAPYRFWSGRELHAAETFDGALRPAGSLPAAPRGAFDWLGGVGLAMDGGGVVAPAAGGAPARLGVPPFVHAVAADARRALVITALGHALLTLDGGASYRDVSAEIGGAVELEVRGDDLAATLPDGRERLVSASGAVTDARAGIGRAVAARGRRPRDDPDRFPDAPPSRAVDAAVRAGVPLADGGVVIAEDGFVARVDLATLRTTSLAALDPGLREAECAPIRTADALLLACADHERAVVVDLAGAPRTERTFDLTGAPDLDRFVGVDGEALGYLGPCDGAAPRDELEVFTGGEPYNASRKRTPVFCARAGRDAWVEHRVDPADAADVIAWIPRAGGGAVALVARWGPFLDDRERVSVRGGLRVVRVPRNEPPFAISPFGWEATSVLDRALWMGPDDAVEGWLIASGNGVGMLAVSIDARGHAAALPGPPRTAGVTAAGRFALAQADDGRLWETTDGGHRWIAVAPPPGSRQGAPVSACSPAGCRVGPFARLGWSAPGAAEAPAEGPPAPPPRPRRAPSRALVSLSCAFDGAPEGKRVPGSAGFGYTPTPQPRGGALVKIGQLGMAAMPHGGPSMPALGDAELAWVQPLDTTAALRRATVPLTRLGLAPGGQRVHELGLGWLLTPGGGLSTFPVGAREPCLAGLLEAAGIARALGGCAEEASVGVELGGRVILVRAAREAITVSAAELPAPRRAGAGPALPVATRELHVTHVGGALTGFTFGVGSRGGAPVLVVLDRSGEASLAPIDPERGTLGAEERLRPLPGAAIGSDPGCAPRPGEATVVLPFEDVIGLDRAALRGIYATGGPGVAVLRWSRERACLDAVELPVRDERFDESQGPYEPHGVLRKVIARFDGRGEKRGATLLVVGTGSEVRQRLSCKALVPGAGQP